MGTTGDRATIEDQQLAVDTFLRARDRHLNGAPGTAAHYERCQESVLKAFDKLIRRIAERNAYQVRNRESVADLMQVGRIGLLTAMRDFDPDRGTPFAAFAANHVQFAVGHHLRDNTWAVHVPRGAKERRSQVALARQTLTENLDRSPTVNEVADFLRTSTDEVLQALLADGAATTYTLDDVPTQGRFDSGFEAAEVKLVLQAFLADCSPIDRQMFLLDIPRNCSQRQIAQQVGVSASYVSRRLKALWDEFHARLRGEESSDLDTVWQ